MAYLFIIDFDFWIGIHTIPTIGIDKATVENEKMPKRTTKTILIKTWRLKDSLGLIYSKIQTHFQGRRPGKNIERDANISAFRMFFTLVMQVYV